MKAYAPFQFASLGLLIGCLIRLGGWPVAIFLGGVAVGIAGTIAVSKLLRVQFRPYFAGRRSGGQS